MKSSEFLRFITPFFYVIIYLSFHYLKTPPKLHGIEHRSRMVNISASYSESPGLKSWSRDRLT
jgi:hypothetical protein